MNDTFSADEMTSIAANVNITKHNDKFNKELSSIKNEIKTAADDGKYYTNTTISVENSEKIISFLGSVGFIVNKTKYKNMYTIIWKQ